jgi:type I restriction enzyme M protein
MAKKNNKTASTQTTANIGFESGLWEAADRLRGSLDASRYKDVVLGLIFLKYISDAFEERHAVLESEVQKGANPEDPDEYAAENVFWVPPEARWPAIAAKAHTPEIGQLIDRAMEAIEHDNRSLRGVLSKDYGRAELDQRRLGELVDLVSNIRVGDKESRAHDLLGRVYEYFLGQFASAEGRKGGEFYTPSCIVRLLVAMIEPFRGRVYDPCCGSGGMFVQSKRFVEEHGGRSGDISIYGQELNSTTWRLAKMNLAIRSIEAQIAQGDTFHNDRFPDLKADFILANPPFNMNGWGADALKKDQRWKYGLPPDSNANFAWMQHMIHHLAPAGVAGIVLANGSLSASGAEGEIRRRIVEGNLVDCIVALPDKLFYTTQIPASLWFLARDRRNGLFRDRREEILFIDTRRMGRMVDRKHRELTEDEIQRIASVYHSWRGEKGTGPYQDIPGFCKSAAREEVAKNDYVLTPGRYVGTEESEQEQEGEEEFAERMTALAAQLREQMAEARRLDEAIWKNLEELGYGG